MAIPCTGCGRSCNDTAMACLYCGAALSPRAPLPAGRLTNPHHLVWLPSGDAKADAASLEALLQVEAYRAALLVRGGGPRIVRTVGDASEAGDLQERAALMGLHTFLVDDHTLDTHPPVSAVERVALAGGAVELGGPAGSLCPAPGTVELIVLGRVPVQRQRTSSRITMLAAEPGATPGLPRVVKQTRTTSDHFGVLDVYPAGAEICWRVREESTDFSGIEPDGPASALIRFARLVEEVRRACPEVPVDERFDRFDDRDRAQAERRRLGKGVTVLDGVARFARHSRLAWLAMRTQ